MSMDEIGPCGRFVRRERDAGCFAGGKTVQEIGHVVAEDAHGAQALAVFLYLLRGLAVDGVPVARGNNGHLHDGGIFEKLFKGGGGAAAARRDNDCCGLVRQLTASGLEQPVEEGGHVARGRGIVNR